MKRRQFLEAGAGFAMLGLPALGAASHPLGLSSEHRAALKARRRRIVMQRL